MCCGTNSERDPQPDHLAWQHLPSAYQASAPAAVAARALVQSGRNNRCTPPAADNERGRHQMNPPALPLRRGV